MEIKDLFQKFYPNVEFKIMELCPYYDSAKSFYGKAQVKETTHASIDKAIANIKISKYDIKSF